MQLIWVVCNLVGLLVLAAGLGLMVAKVGFWGMTVEEVHIVLFTVSLALALLLLIGSCLIIAGIRFVRSGLENNLSNNTTKM